MKATTLKNGKTTDYYYEPEHYQQAFDYYTQLVRTGDIDAFSLTVIPGWGDA
jgi:hypothetical protein